MTDIMLVDDEVLALEYLKNMAVVPPAKHAFL